MYPIVATRPARAIAISLLASALAVIGLGPGTDAGAQVAERRLENPTGTAAGSLANGAGNLKVSLALTTTGQIRVTWKRPAPVKRLKKWTLTVGPTRKLDTKTRTFKVNRKKQSFVLPQAFGATPASGNYSFVQLTVYRSTGQKASSPTKWIQAKIPATCTASEANRVTVATFNVRGWDKDAGSSHTWDLRGPNVVNQILASGAHVIAIQEANGQENTGYGPVRQHQWLLDHLNAADPDAEHDWRDALGDAPYHFGGGLVGTRVFYDAKKFDLLANGMIRLSGKDGKGDSLLPWARLQAAGGTQPAFVFASTHLRVGENAASFQAREAQVAKMTPYLKQLQTTYGGQVVLGGDMNSSINTKPYNHVQYELLKAGFYDSFATPTLINPQYGSTFSMTFPLRVSPYRRDYLMSYGPIKGSCSNTNVVYNDKSQLASDHFLQVAVLPLSVG